MEGHEHYMKEAIREALKGSVERTRPNPRVGAVIVEEGVIVARGHFEEDGGAHAERKAIANLGRPPKSDATLYVTLEPCSTPGRTGACTEAVLESRLARVVVGALDPTPAHRGNGLQVLRDAGMEVVSEVLRHDCEAINPGYGGHVTDASMQ